jgi:multidrug efflux pump subunit AcrA (membrane-fusion protein)
MGPEASGGHRRGRRRWLVAMAAVVVVLAAAGAVVAGARGGWFGTWSTPGSAAGSADHTSTAVVTRRSLTSQTSVNATLGYAGSYTVAGKGGGTLTWLPAQGRVIRQGQVLYRVDNGVPVILLYGKVPLWRALSEGVTGQDVSQLNHDLVKLGYANAADITALGWDYFGWQTKYALQQLQTAVGMTTPAGTATGSLALGQAVFEPAALRVSAVTGQLGSPAAGSVLSATSTTPVVTIKLGAANQSEVKAGDKVTITLPDGTTTPGRVTSVGKVASGSGSSATVPVTVQLRHPKAAGGLDQAPVTVAITTGRVKNALVVPVSALLARPGGGYAVEVTGPGGHHLVSVTPGLFDDAAGLVQVTGSGLAAGQHVVVPAP